MIVRNPKKKEKDVRSRKLALLKVGRFELLAGAIVFHLCVEEHAQSLWHCSATKFFTLLFAPFDPAAQPFITTHAYVRWLKHEPTDFIRCYQINEPLRRQNRNRTAPRSNRGSSRFENGISSRCRRVLLLSTRVCSKVSLRHVCKERLTRSCRSRMPPAWKNPETILFAVFSNCNCSPISK